MLIDRETRSKLPASVPAMWANCACYRGQYLCVLPTYHGQYLCMLAWKVLLNWAPWSTELSKTTLCFPRNNGVMWSVTWYRWSYWCMDITIKVTHWCIQLLCGETVNGNRVPSSGQRLCNLALCWRLCLLCVMYMIDSPADSCTHVELKTSGNGATSEESRKRIPGISSVWICAVPCKWRNK